MAFAEERASIIPDRNYNDRWIVSADALASLCCVFTVALSSIASDSRGRARRILGSPLVEATGTFTYK
jgi:hypothetical protein